MTSQQTLEQRLKKWVDVERDGPLIAFSLLFPVVPLMGLTVYGVNEAIQQSRRLWYGLRGVETVRVGMDKTEFPYYKALGPR